MFKNLITILISFFFALICAELFSRYYFNTDKDNTIFLDRVMLFEKGQTFKNHDNFITYYPNKFFRSKSYLSINQKL